MFLRFHRIVTVTASDGEQALELLKQDADINILLVDIQMPNMSGFDFLSSMRTSNVWCELPIIAVTARAMLGERARILAAGFDGYIAKPFAPDIFVEMVRSILGEAEAVRL
jgi:CheY-like chemotaxis protein